ncbi:MAG: prohibitin family protein [Opitutaceae bacterium]
MNDNPGFFRTRWRRLTSWWASRKQQIVVYLLLLFLGFSFLLVYFWPFLRSRVFVSLDSGQAGILWQRFSGGTNLDYIYTEGFHIVMPWNRLYVYDLRLKQTPHTVLALCKNGLPVEIEVSIRHRPTYPSLPLLHTVVGPNYVEVVVKPEIEAHVRATVSQFDPAELFGSEGYVSSLVVQGAMGEIAQRYVSLDDLLIKQIIFPKQVLDAVQAKLVEEQRALEYQYRIQQAQSEAERKRIEAEGIRAFQESVASSGSFRDFLTYAGIQATLELAKSNNSKVVVFGNNENGLPLMLNLPPDQEAKPTVSPRPTETPRTAPVPSGAGKATPAAPKRASTAPASGAAGNAQ